MTIIADELRALAATASKASKHYHDFPEQVSPAIVIDLYDTIRRLAECLARAPWGEAPSSEIPYWRGRRPPPPPDESPPAS